MASIREDVGLLGDDDRRLPSIEHGLRVKVCNQKVSSGPKDAAALCTGCLQIGDMTEGKGTQHEIERIGQEG